jgi:outer membrane lipoprotein carrier protein
VEAKPREKEAGFERVRLGLSVSGVEAMELVDNFGQTTKLKFSSIVRNPKLDGSEFRFTPPNGADVLGDK